MDVPAPYSLISKKLATSKRLHILLVDEQDIFWYRLRTILKKIDGFDVVAETNHQGKLLDLIAAMSIDLVMMDASLLYTDGVKVIQHLKMLIPPPQVVIFSTVMDDDLLLDAILMGAHGYLTKDLPVREIIRALQGLRRGELALLPSVTHNIIRLLVKRYKSVETVLETYRESDMEENDASSSQEETSSSKNSLDRSAKLALDKLSEREREVFEFMGQGLSNKQIAAKMFISHYTVGKYVRRILRKLGAVNRTQAVSYTSFEGGNAL